MLGAVLTPPIPPFIFPCVLLPPSIIMIDREKSARAHFDPDEDGDRSGIGNVGARTGPMYLGQSVHVLSSNALKCTKKCIYFRARACAPKHSRSRELFITVLFCNLLHPFPPPPQPNI